MFPILNRFLNLTEQNVFYRIILFLTICMNVANLCPFNSYEEALISTEWPVEKTETKFSFQNSLALGFWSQFVPQLQTYNLSKISQIQNIGQRVLDVQTDFDFNLLAYLRFDKQFKTIGYKYLFPFGELYFEYPLKNFVGKWIFTIISFETNVCTIEMTENQKQFIPFIRNGDDIKITLGGEKLILNRENLIYDLNQFKGRISKLIIFQDQENLNFSEISQYCSIPPLFRGEQTLYLIKGLQIFDGHTALTNQVLHTDNKFYLSGWMKYDFSKLFGVNILEMFRITTRKNYLKDHYPTDLILSCQLYTSIETKIIYYQIFYTTFTYPSLETFNGNAAYLSINLPTPEIYSNLSQWHFMRFEYNEQSYNSELFTELIIFNGFGSINNTKKTNLLTNSIYYFYVGGDDYTPQLIYISFYDFKFQYNYESQKQKYIVECHFSCLTCNGPLETNCTSCEQKSNRQFLEEKNVCFCNQGYFEIGNKTCLMFQEYFSQLKVIENNFQESTLDYCYFGYFIFPLNSQQLMCIKCPQSSTENYLCLDCLLNPESWYLIPQCSRDYFSLNNEKYFPYIDQERIEYEYDIYFISEEGILSLNQEYKQFCQNLNNNECFQTERLHLNYHPYVMQKPNYVKYNNDCALLDPLCLKVNKEGECLETVDGIYYFQKEFLLCPKQCTSCYYNIELNIVQCNTCQENLILQNGQCYQCGQYCKLCQNYYDETLKLSYLKCFKCRDDSLYFLSFDGKNCKKNEILFCLFAFEAHKNDFTINTLDYNFTPRNDRENIVIHCAKCWVSVYIFNQQKCHPGEFSRALYSYALDYCDLEVTFQIYVEIMNKGYYQYGNQQVNCVFVGKRTIEFKCTTKQIWLYQDKYGSIQFHSGCSQYNQNCRLCLQGRQQNTYICIVCDIGYYVEKATEKCQKCPDELNCQQCIQQNKLYKDGWKFNVRLFYKQFIEGQDGTHSFLKYAQSENINDYEIICTSCDSGFDLYQDKCVQSCHSSCLKCQIINGQNICIQCPKNLYGKPLTLINNQCIECSQNCALCGVRTQKQIEQINPLFQNIKYLQNSHICFKSYEKDSYFYDQKLKQFIECQKFQACEKEIEIHLNLSCSRENSN